MSDKPSFFFDQFVPGFDFLKNLATGAGNGGASAKPGIPGLPTIPGVSNWIAPTLSVEEVDKRIQELKAVQFWLEQNLHALKATIQALEVQKMTLSTLQGMNLRMEDLAKAFTGAAATGSSAAPAKPEAPKAKPKPEAAAAEGTESKPAAKPAAGVVDPMQLWGALTQQFQQIASTALQDASQLKMPSLLAGKAGAASAEKPARAPAKKATARKRASTARQR
jgi:hypothetical protein